MRDKISRTLKSAMIERDELAVSTLRLMMAAIKMRDIDLRTQTPSATQISDSEILSVLTTMIKQRHESIKTFEAGNRIDLADREREEIKIIQTFLPKPLSAAEVEAAIDQTITDLGASSIRDMRIVIDKLKADYESQIDFAQASLKIKEKLSQMI